MDGGSETGVVKRSGVTCAFKGSLGVLRDAKAVLQSLREPLPGLHRVRCFA